MDWREYASVDDAALKEKLRVMPRSELDEALRAFGTQHALLCQRLEALYSPDRLDRFIRIRPGGLAEIDEEIRQSDPGRPKELALLKTFRDLNRILLPFMDVYEGQVLSDFQQMSQEELEASHAAVSDQLKSAQEAGKDPQDYRQAQNAGGMLRLAKLMQDAIRRELKTRFNKDWS